MLEEAKSHLEVNAVEKGKASLSEGTSLLSERQKLTLLADKSEFGWKTVDEYIQHELADSVADGKFFDLAVWSTEFSWFLYVGFLA